MYKSGIRVITNRMRMDRLKRHFDTCFNVENKNDQLQRVSPQKKGQTNVVQWKRIIEKGSFRDQVNFALSCST